MNKARYLVFQWFQEQKDDSVFSSSSGFRSKKMTLFSRLDHLYCEEEGMELEREEIADQTPPLGEDYETGRHVLLVPADVAEEEWVDMLCSLASNDAAAQVQLAANGGSDVYFRTARKEAVEWIKCAATRHGFSAITALLAVNYFDRCFLPAAARGGSLLRLQGDKPWMGRLAAVACLSLAVKVEETRVPLLLDLQEPAEEGGYTFEPKTIRRMEVLVLSTLGWSMNSVTPLSFIHHLLPRLCQKDKNPNPGSLAVGIAARIRELAARSEAALLSVIADWTWVTYPASVWAAAVLMHVTESGENHHIISLLNAQKDVVEQCHRLMEESRSSNISGRKRKLYSSSPPSPSGVIGSCFPASAARARAIHGRSGIPLRRLRRRLLLLLSRDSMEIIPLHSKYCESKSRF